MNKRAYNFGAGPAMLPEPILLEAQKDWMNWQNTGMSVLEVNHRSKHFKALLEEAEADLRTLMGIPDGYQVLFLGGAARAQFAMIPMNLLQPGETAGYLISGTWSSLAFAEARKCAQAYCIAGSEEGLYSIPETASWQMCPDTAYVYYTPNETIQGLRFPARPDVAPIPLIADMTSCLLSEPVHVADFGLIFAGAQKNIAGAGLTIVIVREDLLARHPAQMLPTMMDYRVHAEHRSIYATPPVFQCYLASRMFKWIQAQGGVENLYQITRQKAARLYEYLDNASFYHCRVKPAERSLVNICFSLVDPALEPEFISQAETQGLLALQGHRLTGGVRASLYNAMPMAGVEALLAFMETFADVHGR